MAQNSGGSHSYTSSRRVCDHGDWLEVPTCKCGKEMNIFTSWTEKNPGRRFWTCVGNGTRKCDCWEWADPPICNRAKKIIPGLLNKINTQEEEIKLLKMCIKKQKRKKCGPFMFGVAVPLVIGILVYVFLM